MSILTQKRYIFRRRPIRGRVAMVLIVSCAIAAAISVVGAKAKPGGYQRLTVVEAPAD